MLYAYQSDLATIQATRARQQVEEQFMTNKNDTTTASKNDHSNGSDLKKDISPSESKSACRRRELIQAVKYFASGNQSRDKNLTDSKTIAEIEAETRTMQAILRQYQEVHVNFTPQKTNKQKTKKEKQTDFRLVFYVV